MNFIIRTLNNMGEELQKKIKETEDKLDGDHELYAEQVFLETDLENYKTQLSEIQEALSKLI